MPKTTTETKTVKIHGKPWKIEITNKFPKPYGRCAGLCWDDDRKIQIKKSLDSWQHLVVLIHECLHAADKNQSEEWVTQTANDLATIVWDSGYECEE